MKLTRRDTAMFNAALCLVHDSGYNVGAINQEVQLALSAGFPVKKAYQRALNKFTEATPDMLEPLRKVTQLIQASDDNTVAHYNVALSHYIETGDSSAMDSLADVVAQDFATLAARNGEAVPDAQQDAGLSASSEPA